MFRALLLSISLFLPTLTLAQSCGGLSFWEDLTQDQQLALTQKAAATPYGSGNFWQATKDGTTLTVVGTMHLPDPRHDAFFDLVSPSLDDADLLLVEATQADQSAMQVHMARNPDMVTLNDGTTLPDRMDAATWDLIRDAALERGVPGFMAAKMQPWFLSMTLAIPPCAMPAMVAGDGGLDAILMDHAATHGIPTASLEPWKDMLDFLASGTIDEQIDALRIGIVATEIQEAALVALIDLYFAEQTAMGWYIYEYTKNFLPPEAAALFDDQWAELERVLLNQRNANWIPVIEDAAARHDTVFVAFGAAHLFGDQGVLNLLANNGWDISPL